LINKNIFIHDDTLASLLPEYASKIANADKITLRMLLRHRSGIPDFYRQKGFDWLESHTDNDKALAFILDKPANFFPDSRFEYSNTNFLLIGKVLDKVLGYDHQLYIRKEILDPLGMTLTFATINQADIEKVVSGYWRKKDADLLHVDYTIPGGSMVASAKDIATFIRALNTGTFFNAQEQAIYSSIYSYEHTGWLPGYQSFAYYHPDIDTVIILFVGTTGGFTEWTAYSTYRKVVSVLRH
jgi:CubicO group peptidase (beta-lactamase class C family)